jgi:hypothetical protein
MLGCGQRDAEAVASAARVSRCELRQIIEVSIGARLADKPVRASFT